MNSLILISFKYLPASSNVNAYHSTRTNNKLKLPIENSLTCSVMNIDIIREIRVTGVAFFLNNGEEKATSGEKPDIHSLTIT